MMCWSLDFATAPYYYRWRKQDADWRENSRDILLLMNGLVFVVCAIGILLFAEARSLVFGTKFIEADAVGPLLLVAGMFQPLYFMTVKPYFYLKRTALLSRITFMTSAVIIAGSIATIWQYGYVAAAAMTILSYASVAAIGYWLSLRLEPPPFGFSEALIPTLVCASMAALVLLLELSLGAKLFLCLLVVVGAARFAILRPLKALQQRNAFRI
jgi:O-antigen/teichoic acid export membrane protein